MSAVWQLLDLRQIIYGSSNCDVMWLGRDRKIFSSRQRQSTESNKFTDVHN